MNRLFRTLAVGAWLALASCSGSGGGVGLAQVSSSWTATYGTCGDGFHYMVISRGKSSGTRTASSTCESYSTPIQLDDQLVTIIADRRSVMIDGMRFELKDGRLFILRHSDGTFDITRHAVPLPEIPEGTSPMDVASKFLASVEVVQEVVTE